MAADSDDSPGYCIPDTPFSFRGSSSMGKITWAQASGMGRLSNFCRTGKDLEEDSPLIC